MAGKRFLVPRAKIILQPPTPTPMCVSDPIRECRSTRGICKGAVEPGSEIRECPKPSAFRKFVLSMLAPALSPFLPRGYLLFQHVWRLVPLSQINRALSPSGRQAYGFPAHRCTACPAARDGLVFEHTIGNKRFSEDSSGFGCDGIYLIAAPDEAAGQPAAYPKKRCQKVA